MNNPPMAKRPDSGSQWARRVLGLIKQALFVCTIIALYTWLNHWMVSTSAQKFSMRISREQGETSKASRCGECLQMGDTSKISVWGDSGATDFTTEIYVFYHDKPLLACSDCRTLVFKIPAVGHYQIMGLLRPRNCQVDISSLDAISASAAYCSTTFNHSSFNVQ